MNERIGFIGLGDLGAPVAGNLLDAGYDLHVYNRTQSKADALVARGAVRAARPADAATTGGVVATLLWDGASVEEVVRSDGFLGGLGPEGVHVSMTTISPETSRILADLHTQHGSQFVEAPIFGRPEAASARKLWVPVAGPAAAKARVKPHLEAMGAQGVFDFGETVGSALAVKLAGNFLIMSAVRSLTEAAAMLEGTAADVPAVLDMLTKTLFPAPIYQSYGRMIASGTATMGQSGIPAKDLGLFKATAEAVQSRAPIATMLLEPPTAP